MNLSQKRAPAPKPVAVRKERKGLKASPSAPDNKAYFNHTAFFQERGAMCECGDCGEHGGQAHHSMIGRQKKYPILDMKYNRNNVNAFEHTQLKKFDNLTWRRRFFLLNCERYGREKMIEDGR